MSTTSPDLPESNSLGFKRFFSPVLPGPFCHEKTRLSSYSDVAAKMIINSYANATKIAGTTAPGAWPLKPLDCG
ncbi:hypothetical protein PAAG_06492 [Paracoccidioides lutzii Pb01]|uniref:Uncharacterized protein n=1 Tax=Paracoccidioides lutzii (strain ATCC MYA-826 / Pb01) TaxID=502779 RepID=C1H6V1_PARBA|nr:hypothetical protein PAAG_06492 [Paracoccidioides lutzii Pb01]EEH35445.2 hypothetical protein PAAG_06492 [Paracoccidioides lutzii Pb01]